MTKFAVLKEGDILSESQFYSVNKIKGDQIELKNDANDETIVVNKGYVETFLKSATQYSSEIKETKTELAERFKGCRNIALEVCFHKQVQEKDVVVEITEAYGNSTPKEFETKLKKAVKKALQGEERVLIGKHNGAIDEFGRIHVTDMAIAKDATKAYDVRQRLVDPRTIQWVIVDDVKYSIK